HEKREAGTAADSGCGSCFVLSIHRFAKGKGMWIVSDFSDIIHKCSTSFWAERESSSAIKAELLRKWFYAIVPTRGRVADMEIVSS
ncbi:MAG: hypothetical protein Q4D15_09670, partial [Lachnospiraceae bacterium]|nr:hypothetical protein [Lachnospiraceae bacterium]